MEGEIHNNDMLAMVLALQKQLQTQQLELQLSLERESILKENSQYDNKELAQVELMAQLKTLHKKVESQEAKLEESLNREDGLRSDVEETKRICGELKEEIRVKDEIILDLRERLAQYEPESLAGSTLDVSSRKSSVPSLAPPCECLNTGFQNCMLYPSGFCDCSASCSFVKDYLQDEDQGNDRTEMVSMRSFSGLMTPIDGDGGKFSPSELQNTLEDLAGNQFLMPPNANGNNKNRNNDRASPTDSNTSSSTKSSKVNNKKTLSKKDSKLNDTSNNSKNKKPSGAKGAPSKPLNKNNENNKNNGVANGSKQRKNAMTNGSSKKDKGSENDLI